MAISKRFLLFIVLEDALQNLAGVYSQRRVLRRYSA
jgi:hypothetical protein